MIIIIAENVHFECDKIVYMKECSNKRNICFYNNGSHVNTQKCSEEESRMVKDQIAKALETEKRTYVMPSK